jgi:hypothetical protein
MYQQKAGPRFEHREKEARRVQAAPVLADRFRQLKSLTVGLEYFSQDRLTRNSQIKYTVNLDHVRSVFRFNCPNSECIRGDFDLTEELAAAVARRRTSARGEMSCQGWQSKTTIDTVRCHTVLRYTLSLGY